MATISLCMIVKNEEEVLGRCLDSIKGLVDEIIIVDTGSEDQTKEIASRYTDKIYDFEWTDDFSKARNFSFSKGTKDYLMWLDADDVILKDQKKKFLKFKKSLTDDIDIVMFKYNVGFDNAGNVTLSYFRERLFKRINQYQWEDRVHEFVPPMGKIVEEEIFVTHQKLKAGDPKRNLHIYRKMQEENVPMTPRNLFYFSRELRDNGESEEAIEYYTKFLDTGQAWVEDAISACVELAACYGSVGNENMRVQSILRSFVYDKPRARVCCEMGQYFLDKMDYDKAIYWYKLALTIEPEQGWGFIRKDYYDFIPSLYLCVCYDRLGDKETAQYYHEQTVKLKPEHPSVIYNTQYFQGEEQSEN